MFTAVGEALLDMVQPSAGDVYRALPAGGPLNIAVGLRRLGHPTSLMARLSTGALGSRVRSYAEANGLDLSASVTTDEQVTLAFATVDAGGRASYDFYVHDTADWGWTAAELSRLPEETRAVHTGSLATAMEPGGSRIAAWWESLARSTEVLLSFDPNVRPTLAGPRSTAVERVERLVSLSHVVKASEEDVDWLYPAVAPADAIRRWSRLGPALVVLTRGPDGCLAVRADGTEVAAFAPDVAVVDTIGAGDAFQAGLLSGLADVGALSARGVRALSHESVRDVLERAAGVAALTCGRPGADPPTRAEYDEWWAQASGRQSGRR